MLRIVLICVFLVLLFGISVVCAEKLRSFQSRFNSKEYKLCSEQNFQHVRLESNFLLKLLHLLWVTDKIFTETSVRYCAIGGTLLSIERNGYLTPWDDDGDVCVFESDYKLRENDIKLLLDEHKVQLTDPFWFANLKVLQLRLIDDHPFQKKFPTDEQPFVDWMMFKPERIANGAVRMNFSSDDQKKLFPKSYLKLENLFPLRRKKLETFSAKVAVSEDENFSVNLRVPNNPLPLLNRDYGTQEEPEKWRYCYLASSHRSAFLFVDPCQLTKQQILNL